MANKRLEQELQEAVVQYLDMAIFHDTTFFWSTPNETGQGGKRGAILGAIRKRMGVKSGMPDLMLAYKGDNSPNALVIGIELKTAKGRLQPTQKAMAGRFKLLGWSYHLCRSLDDIADVMEAEGIPSRVRRLPLMGVIE